MPPESLDIKPYTPIAVLNRDEYAHGPNATKPQFARQLVAALCGMAPTFVKKVVGPSSLLSHQEVLMLLDQDAFAETFVPRSRINAYLERNLIESSIPKDDDMNGLVLGSALDLIPQIGPGSVQAVVTSTPYWAMRMYSDMVPSRWADGEVCAFGMEQTPEGFIRHSVEILYLLIPAMKAAGSIWWNLGDTYSTRTQIRSNAVEALHAMQGKDKKKWHDHAARRYSAGHAYLKDGEQSLIPSRIAERAQRIGLYVKSMISWVKTSSMPEPQKSRVSRNIESIIHFTLQRTPVFHKESYLDLPSVLGGRSEWETAKLSDAWILPTSSGRGGHGAQFPLALPGRCIALSTDPGDLILDPFMGSGTTALAAEQLDRKWLGFDVSETYLAHARDRISKVQNASIPDLEADDRAELSDALF